MAGRPPDPAAGAATRLPGCAQVMGAQGGGQYARWRSRPAGAQAPAAGPRRGCGPATLLATARMSTAWMSTTWLSTALLSTALLAGCVYTPRTVEVYDPACRILTRQMVLDERQVGVIGRCHNEGCVAALVAFGAVSAVTAVVSGSIVVVGNVAYWFEKRSACQPVDPPPAGRVPPERAAPPAQPAPPSPASPAPVPPSPRPDDPQRGERVPSARAPGATAGAAQA